MNIYLQYLHTSSSTFADGIYLDEPPHYIITQTLERGIGWVQVAFGVLKSMLFALGCAVLKTL